MLTEKEIIKKRKLLHPTDHQLAQSFKALGDLTRLRIFRVLADHPKISVSTIAKILHLSAPLTSQHIKILTHAKLLEKSRTGKRIFSKLHRPNPLVRELVKAIHLTINAKK